MCFALPDLALYLIYGFDGLKLGLPAIGCATLYFVATRTTMGIRNLLGIRLAQSIAIACVAAVLQSIPLTALVR